MSESQSQSQSQSQPVSGGGARTRHGAGQLRKKRKVAAKKQGKEGGTGDHEQVLALDVAALLASARAEKTSADGDDDGPASPPATVVRPWRSETFPETEVTVATLSSTGDGLALSPRRDHVYVVPFTVPGDVARVKIVRSLDEHSLTDLLEVVRPGPLRDDAQVRCPYFGRCSGCQLQMMKYPDQLAHKRRIIEKAYANFSGLEDGAVPAVGETVGSPLQYGYRTKLTPHFPKPTRKQVVVTRREEEVEVKAGGGAAVEAVEDSVTEETVTEVPPIGFNYKGRQAVLDIEDCPLGTDIVRMGLKSERRRVADTIGSYKLGATLLLRESTPLGPDIGAAARILAQ
ncbi:tRNA(m5U54)methyltransferase [Ascosphaera acerosa]|nr:tRNA(m5U54)methyltransferase [Ascosphaera acerosa]